MEEQGGAQAFLDTLTAGLEAEPESEEGDSVDGDEGSQVEPEAEPSTPIRTAADILVDAMLEEATNSFECKFINCVYSLLEHWAFVTEKTDVLSADSTFEKRAGLQAEAESLGRAVAVSFVSLVGTSVRCSYLHAFVYAFPPMIFTLGHILRASMEGFEHSNK
eukprot:6201557-Pleurochrysis_carterae.AAC.1